MAKKAEFSKAFATELNNELSMIPPLPPSQVKLTTKQLVEAMTDGIEYARSQGYTLEQIAEFLTDKNAKISVTSLQRYLPKIAVSKARKKPARTPKPAPAIASTESSNTTPVVDAISTNNEPSFATPEKPNFYGAPNDGTFTPKPPRTNL